MVNHRLLIVPKKAAVPSGAVAVIGGVYGVGKPIEHCLGADDDAAPELVVHADLAAAHKLNVGRRRKGAADRVGKIGAAQPAPGCANIAADIEAGPIVDEWRLLVDRRRDWSRKIGCQCRRWSVDAQNERQRNKSPEAIVCCARHISMSCRRHYRDFFPVFAACCLFLLLLPRFTLHWRDARVPALDRYSLKISSIRPQRSRGAARIAARTRRCRCRRG